ncbi:MAG: hypothetical protein DRN04_17720 [Thermoprotei archaeon]|nr:MAG: hypothetical protein DRN04_17720 [Thermoprotei archaeon]
MYNEALSERNNIATHEACLTQKEADRVIAEGSMVREWNGTITLNWAEWPAKYKGVRAKGKQENTKTGESPYM